MWMGCNLIFKCNRSSTIKLKNKKYLPPDTDHQKRKQYLSNVLIHRYIMSDVSVIVIQYLSCEYSIYRLQIHEFSAINSCLFSY
jgi:hypothetical protein